MNDNTMTNARLLALFATHPNINVFFITADGQPFFTDEAAQSHAQRQPDKNVLPITREDVEGAEPATFADGLGEDEADVVFMHPTLAGPFNDFLKAEGSPDEHSGGVIVPPANILAEPDPVIKTPELPAATVIALPTAGAPKLSLLEIAMATPEGERTSYQKGLITQARNAAEADALKKGGLN